MAERVLSCALFIESPAGVLLAHATGTPRWDLPKGRREAGEAPIDAALRECLEETGLDFRACRTKLQDRGQHPYLREKDLHLFCLRIDRALNLSGCCCTTRTTRADGREVWETDAYEWVPREKIAERVGKSLVNYLRELSLIPAAPRPTMRPR